MNLFEECIVYQFHIIITKKEVRDIVMKRMTCFVIRSVSILLYLWVINHIDYISLDLCIHSQCHI